MRSLIVLLAMLCFVSGRNLHESNENEDIGTDDFMNANNDAVKNLRDPSYNQMRHQRKRRQSFYDFSPYYHERDYSCRDEINILRNEILQERRHNNEMILQLLKIVEEALKRPPPPPPQQPQVIYVPVPVSFLQLPVIKDNVTFPSRWPQVDINRVWGVADAETPVEIDDNDDGSRPISYEPHKTDESAPKPPPVEHGSSQAGMQSTTRRSAAKPSAKPNAKPSACQATIIICCSLPDERDQKECFEKYNCSKTFTTGFSCSPLTIEKVLEAYKKSYALN